jgi:hypothetical protein
MKKKGIHRSHNDKNYKTKNQQQIAHHWTQQQNQQQIAQQQHYTYREKQQEQKLGPMDKTERNSRENGDTKGKRAEPAEPFGRKHNIHQFKNCVVHQPNQRPPRETRRNPPTTKWNFFPGGEKNCNNQRKAN